jgi:hypothetical protein
MTDLMNATRMGQVARVTDLPLAELPEEVLTLCWTVDQESGRPAGHWVLAAKPASSALDA